MAFPLAPPSALLLPAAAAGASASRRSAAGAQPPLAASDARLAFVPRLARPRGRRGASVAAAAAPAKDRGEWTRFLEVTGDAVRAATVDCKLLPGARVAEVTVVAPDRPGLLSDIAAAIASLGLTIDKARVTTPDANVKDTFEVACKSGEPLTESRMASIRTAIVQSAAASPLKASTATARGVEARVEVLSFDEAGTSKPSWVVTVESDDSPGLLSKMMTAFTALKLDINSAEIRTTAGTVRNKFSVARKDGISAQAISDAVKAALK